MRNAKWLVVATALVLLQACGVVHYMTPHPITAYSLDGEVLKGEYTFTGTGKGNIKVTRVKDGEVFTGEFTSVDNTTFSSSYGQAFGSAYGTAYAPGATILSNAYGSASGNSFTTTTGGRFHGMGFLTGKDAVMQCFYMGSMRTYNGIGKCKSNHGKEYDVQF